MNTTTRIHEPQVYATIQVKFAIIFIPSIFLLYLHHVAVLPRMFCPKAWTQATEKKADTTNLECLQAFVKEM